MFNDYSRNLPGKYWRCVTQVLYVTHSRHVTWRKMRYIGDQKTKKQVSGLTKNTVYKTGSICITPRGGNNRMNIFDVHLPQPIITITSEEDGWVWEVYE